MFHRFNFSAYNYWTLAEKTTCKCFTVSILALMRFIETNVNISNELNISNVHRSVNYIVASNVYMNRGSCNLHATKCSFHFDTPQKNEIHSLIKYNVHKYYK